MTVPPRFVHVGFDFSGEQAVVTELEELFSKALDWARYDTHCWILYTNTELEIWRDRIRNLPSIKNTDSFFLCDFERGKSNGYLQKTMWDWLNKSR